MIRQALTQSQNSQQKSTDYVQSGWLQRQCSSGNKTGSENECLEYNSNKRLHLQTKLKIGKPDDIYEREADRIADQVTSNQAHANVSSSPLQISKFSNSSNQQSGFVPESVHHTLSSAGRPLDNDVREDMEQKFGYDFSQVQVHTGSQADDSAREINAHAYTAGQHIVFDSSSYSPSTSHGRRLVAHELSHVVQQENQSKSSYIQKQRRRRRNLTSVRNPVLALYQYNAPENHRNHFRRKANYITRAIDIGDPTTSSCPSIVRRRAMPYQSGSEIVSYIRKSRRCTNHPVSQVHIFGHGNYDVIDAAHGRRGSSLYSTNSTRSLNRSSGGRTVQDIPTTGFLARNVVFVLHGCSIGAGDDSLAQQLFSHIRTTSPNGRVFAHYDSGRCGRDIHWRLFSDEHQSGRRGVLNPYYRDTSRDG